MASRIGNREIGHQSLPKKKKRHARRKINVCNTRTPFKQNCTAKPVVKRKQKRPINTNPFNMQFNSLCNIGQLYKRRGRNNNVNKRSSKNRRCENSENTVTSTSDTVIVCDSDTDTESDDGIIEVHDSVLEAFSVNKKSTEKTKIDEVIVLDDSQNEESSTPCKRLRPVRRKSAGEQKINSASAPNSIVIVLSNTPSLKHTDAAEVIEIDDSCVQEEADSTSKDNINSTSVRNTQSSQLVTAKNTQVVQPKRFDFIPLTTPIPRLDNSSTICSTNPTVSPNNIKITVCGRDRSFHKMGAHNVNFTAPSSNRNAFSFPSTSNNSVPQQMTRNLLPKITVGSMFGDNLYNAGHINKKGLRDIIIDGSNVAMRHSLGKFFSVKGLKICIDYFLQRGHKVKAFVPQYRIKHGQCSEPALLKKLHDQGLVILTPSRVISGKKITSYDDRLLVQCAAELEAVVVSGDNYRDLLKENPNLRDTIEKRLLIPTWVDDIILFPSDPLGRFGPTLDQFLKFP